MFSHRIADRVEFRVLETRHADDLFSVVQRNFERLAEWCPWVERTATIDSTREFLREKIERFAEGNGFTSGFFIEGELLGVVALEYIDRPNLTTEIGYWLDSEIEGRGLVTLACRRLIDHAFGELGLRRVQIRCAEDNFRSRAIPEKLGFKKEGIIRRCERLGNRTVDLVVYGMLAEEWKSTT